MRRELVIAGAAALSAALAGCVTPEQARYAAETGCRTLRVKHNHMIGYFVEVPQNVGEDLLKEPRSRRDRSRGGPSAATGARRTFGSPC